MQLQINPRRLVVEGRNRPVDLRLQRPVREDDRQDMDGYCSHITTAAGAGIHWVIVGGESGPGARPMHPDWARSLREQCQAAGTAFLFKQWGEWAPYDRSRTNGAALATPYSLDEPLQHFGKKVAGRLLDGRTWDEFPAT